MKLSEITEATILEAAIEQLSKKDGYDPGHYFTTSIGSIESLQNPGPNVGATCAIGGVEQAIWRLTKQNVRPERLFAAYEETAARNRRVSVLYAGVMRRLNDVARKNRALRDAFDGDITGCPIEQLTFVASKRVVLNAFKKALAGAQA